MRDLDSNSRSLDDVMKMLNPSFLAQVAGITALVSAYTKLVGAMASFAKQSIKTYSAFEKIQTELSTFYGDASKGKSTFEELRKLSNSTTFGVDELASSFTQLANSGVAVDSINDKLVMLGNIAGGSKQKFAELTSIYSKIASTGRAGAMQLQQLALRGIPIRKVLQEMGVQGVATADDITEAFKRMTAEGGQFYNAMGNILDTIEGKEGEVQDFFKEFTVNFAEATGLAEAYKGVLEVVRNALEKLADIFREIGSDNPVFKALFTGALLSILTALTTVIGIALLGALKKFNAELTKTAVLKGIINPAQFAIGLGLVTGALVAGGIALKGFTDKQREANQAMSEGYKSAKQQCEEVKNLRETLASGGTIELEGHLAINNAETSSILYKKTQVESEIENARKRLNSEDETERNSARIRLDSLESQLALYDKQLERHKQINDNLNKRIESLKQISALEKTFEKLQSTSLTLSENVRKTVEETLRSTDDYKIEAIDKKIKDIELELSRGYKTEKKDIFNSSTKKWESQTVNTPLDQSEKEARLQTISILQKELEDTRKKMFKPEEWAKLLGSLTGVDVTQNSASKIFGDYRKKIYEAGANIGTFKNTDMDMEFWRQYGNNAVNIINTAISSGLFARDTVQTKEMLANGIDALKKGAEQFGKGDIGSEEYRQNLQQSLNLIKTMNTLGADAEELYKLRQGYESEFLASLDKEYAKTHMSTDELQKQELIKNGMSEETADRTIKMGKVIDAGSQRQKAEEDLKNAIGYNNELQARMNVANAKIYEYMVLLQQGMGDRKKVEEKLTEAIKERNKTYGEITAKNAWESAVSGSDVGTFIQSGQTEDGFDAKQGVIGLFIQLVAKVVGGMKGFQQVLSPITAFLEELTVILKPFLIVCMIVSAGMKAVGKAIVTVLDMITFGWFSKMSDEYDDLMESMDGTKEKFADLTSEMQKLSDAIAEQAEYYLQKKKELNAQTYVEGVGFKSVNDMILTPQGQFSTHPDDYIIATKDPKSLGSGKTSVVMIEPTIINNASKDVSATISTKQEGDMTKMIVMISKKVASDVASGDNGWDSAMQQRENRIQGRRIAL